MKNQSINRTWNAGKVSAILAIFAFASLSGCVINSSDVASVTTTTPPLSGNAPDRTTASSSDVIVNGVLLDTSLTPEQVTEEAEKNADAATGEIKQGSTSQSSDSGSIVGILSAAFNSDNPREVGSIVIENAGGSDSSWEISTVDTENNTGVFLNYGYVRNRFHDDEGTNVYAYFIDRATDGELLAINYFTDESAADDEYIVGGLWRDYETDYETNGNGIEIQHTGVFVDVLSGVGLNFDDPIYNPNIGFRNNIATYIGWGRSLVSFKRGESTAIATTNRNQDVVLNVNFGTEQISGEITKTPRHYDGEDSYISKVVLKESTFDPDNRGFLSDGVAEWVWTNSYTYEDADSVTVTGRWGGQFYNPNAKVFAGTYGADNEEGVNILGFFGAYRIDDCDTSGGGFGTRQGDADEFNVCTPFTGLCSPTGAAASEGEYDRDGRCVALQGSCDIGNFVGNGVREDLTGICMPASGGECIGSGVNAGLYDGTGACVALSGSCTGAGINVGEYDGTGTCAALTGSCTGAGVNVGERDGTGTCLALTGSCSGAGINVGERDGTGTCLALTGSCSGENGVNAGERDGTGTCLALTGSCGTGDDVGIHDDVGDCISFASVIAPTATTAGITNSIGGFVMTNAIAAALLRNKVSMAANANPQEGSMTQSSEVADRVGIFNENSVTYGATGEITIAISNSGSGVTWSEISTSDTDIVVSYSATATSNFKSINLLKKTEGAGNLFVDVRTDIARPEIEETLRRSGADDLFTTLQIGDRVVPIGRYEGSSTVLIEDTQTGRWFACNDYRPTTQCRDVVELVDSSGEKRRGLLFIGDNPEAGFEGEASYSGEFSADGMTVDITYAGEFRAEATFLPSERVVLPDIDYLVGGTWLYVPETGGNWEIGAFADGSRKLEVDFPLTGEATYTGKAFGLRLNDNEVSNFEGNVNLTADFGRRTGESVSDFRNGGGRIAGSITGDDLANPIKLNTASYDLGGANRGTFTDGTTEMEDGYSGKWGGQFYGRNVANPSAAGDDRLKNSSVSGTFGVSKGNPIGDDFDSYVGFFGATEQ